jgi:hypothetical protein
MRAVRGSWVLLVASLALLTGAVMASPAGAADANSVPPQVELTAAGIEGILGSGKEDLAHFVTVAPDPSYEYSPESEVHFACAVDARTVPCVGSYDGCCRVVREIPVRAAPESPAAAGGLGLGVFRGAVLKPKWLADGPHTVTVTATDEDGTSAPVSVDDTYDIEPPSTPRLTQVPPRVGHERKPIFRFTSTDDARLLSKRGEPFRAVLRRLAPPWQTYRPGFGGSYLGTWDTACPSLLTCEGRSQAEYEASEHGSLFFGVPERLVAGPYEFKVRARDAVGNKSAYARYRFRIVPGKPR